MESTSHIPHDSVTTIDTIILHSNFNYRTYDKVTKYKRRIEDYTITASNNKDPNNFGLSIRKDNSANFVHFNFTKYKHKSVEYTSTYITISLNHFMFQHRRFSQVTHGTIINKLQNIISQVLHFPDFQIDMMSVSEIHLSSDIIVDEPPKNYLQLLSHIPFSNYIITHTNGNDTLSIHSNTKRKEIFKDRKSLLGKLSDMKTTSPFDEIVKKDSDKIATPIATIYDKSKKLNEVNKIETDLNIIRFEFKFKGVKKNNLTHRKDTLHLIFNGDNYKGVKKFTDIFTVDIDSAIRINMFDRHLLKYRDKCLDDLITREHWSQSSKYLTKWSNTNMNNDDSQYHIDYLQADTKEEKRKIRRDFKRYKKLNFLKQAQKKVSNSNKSYWDLYQELINKTESDHFYPNYLHNTYQYYSSI